LVGFWEQSFLHSPFKETTMPMPNLSSVSVDALLKLRDEVEEALSRRAKELHDQLSRLGHSALRGGGSSLKGPKGSSQIPRWIREHMGWKRSTARLAAGEAQSGSKARRLCCSQNGRSPQGLAQETSQGQTLSVAQNLL